jgi:hypothetical protein
MRPTGPETSVRKYLYLVRKNPEERSSQLLRCGNLKSRVVSVLNIGDNGESPCIEYWWYGTCFCTPLFDTWMSPICDSKTVKCVAVGVIICFLSKSSTKDSEVYHPRCIKKDRKHWWWSVSVFQTIPNREPVRHILSYPHSAICLKSDSSLLTIRVS